MSEASEPDLQVTLNAIHGAICSVQSSIDLLRAQTRGAARGPRWLITGTAAHKYPDEWNAWLSFYGLPPILELAMVPIVFDSDTRTLTATRFVLDDNGRRIAANYEMLKEPVTVVVHGVLRGIPPGAEVTVE